MQIHRYSVVALVSLLISCPRTATKDVETGDVADSDTAAGDSDGDGFAQSEDCNDSDASVHPDARELCDEIDNDCDGLLDDEDPDVFGADTWYADYDLDGRIDVYVSYASAKPKVGGWVDAKIIDDQTNLFNSESG